MIKIAHRFCSKAVCCTIAHLQMLLWPRGMTLISWYFTLCSTLSCVSPHANFMRCVWVDPVTFMSTPITDNGDFLQWPSCSESFLVNLLPKSDHTCTKTFQQVHYHPQKLMWNSYDELGVAWCTSVACTVCDTRTSSSAKACEGFMWLCVVLWCSEVWWGWALPAERLWRRRETVVNLVVAADGVRQLKFTTPGKRKQRPSTVAWPLRKPPAYHVITS